MNKQADIKEQLRDLIQNVKARGRDAGGHIGEWYSNLDPTMRNTVMRGLAGGAIGAGALGGLSAITPETPGVPRTGVMSNALLGALLGGGAAAALPVGAKMLQGNLTFHGDQSRHDGHLLDPLLKTVAKNPVTTGALGVGGYLTAFDPAGRQMREGLAATKHLPWLKEKLRAFAEKATWTMPKVNPQTGQALPIEAGTRLGGRSLAASIPIALLLARTLDKAWKGDY